MISIIDLQASIRKELISNAALTALVADRIYTTHFYDFDNGTVEMPLVIVELEGGSANYAGKNQSISFFVYAYSRESSSQASEVYDKISGALHLTQVDNGQRGFIQEVARPISGYNPTARSYFIRGSYLALTAE
jgi:hypothetical protein